MRKVQGDIWGYLGHAKVVITTNVGWKKLARKRGQADDGIWENNMGAGLALQAARRWPELPAWYAQTLRAAMNVRDNGRGVTWWDGDSAPPIEHPRLPLIFLPVKPMSNEGPEYSWDQEASLPLIEYGLERLAKHAGEIALTLPGCGNGKLKPEQVLPLLEKHLLDDRFVLVDRQLATPENPLEDLLKQPGALWP